MSSRLPVGFYVRAPIICPFYSSLRRGGMSFAGAGRVQVGGDEKNSFMSRGIITDFLFFFFLEGSKSGRVRDDP